MLRGILIIALIAASPSLGADPAFFSEMEPLFQDMKAMLEQSGHSPKEGVQALKTARDAVQQRARAEAQTELEAVLSQDTLVVGPLPVIIKDETARSGYRSLSPHELQARAQEIVHGLETAFEASRDRALGLIKRIGTEYGTCQAKTVASFEAKLVELSTWADSRVWWGNEKSGIRWFNTRFHQLHARLKEEAKLLGLDCLIARLSHRIANPPSAPMHDRRERTGKALPHELTGYPTVVDADTLILSDMRVRLHGVDAPEKEQSCIDANGTQYRCGGVATEALRAKIGTAPVRCIVTGPEKYRRLVGHCHLGKVDLNGWLVANGYALAYRPFSVRYVAQEDEAKAAKRGIWSGSFTPPWEWRKQH